MATTVLLLLRVATKYIVENVPVAYIRINQSGIGNKSNSTNFELRRPDAPTPYTYPYQNEPVEGYHIIPGADNTRKSQTEPQTANCRAKIKTSVRRVKRQESQRVTFVRFQPSTTLAMGNQLAFFWEDISGETRRRAERAERQ